MALSVIAGDKSEHFSPIKQLKGEIRVWSSFHSHSDSQIAIPYKVKTCEVLYTDQHYRYVAIYVYIYT